MSRPSPANQTAGWAKARSSGIGSLLFLGLSFEAHAQALDMRLSAWEVQALPKVERQTQWTQGEAGHDGGLTIQAHSNAAASGLTRAVQWPGDSQLAWRWQVSRSLSASNSASKSGDDYAARLYVFFDPPDAHLGFAGRLKLLAGRKVFGDSLPRAAICYVWGHHDPVGTLAPNPYTDRVRMVVVDSGDEFAGQWRAHQRDLAADYTAAFGHSSAPPIIGVSIMSDTDNSGDEVRARFAGIRRVSAESDGP